MEKQKTTAATAAAAAAAAATEGLDPGIVSLLKLYQNTLSTMGIPRIESLHSVGLDKRARLAHARWMCDSMLNPPDGKMKIKMADPVTVRGWLGFIWGLLWADEVFPLAAIRDHARGLGENTG